MIIPVCPTRGLIFNETLDSLKRNGIDINNLITVSGLPIPDAPNHVVAKALDLAPSYVLMIEDDMVIPDGALEQMLKMDKAIVCIDYPVINGWSTIARKDGVIQHCGLGCTLIKAGVFKNLPQPWFETDKSVDYNTDEIIDKPAKYGGHDILFFRKARENGYEITQLPNYEAKHLRCEELHRSENNNGFYKIYSLPEVSQREE